MKENLIKSQITSMKLFFLTGMITLMLLTNMTKAQPVIPYQQANIREENMKQIFIDKFIVPENARREFTERMTINRNFIKKLKGFIKDEAYQRTDENGNMIFITIAVWKDEDALKKAKEAVQAEYKKQGFNPSEMLQRLNIVMDRGTYNELMPLP